jgi:hypothetical protein
MKTIHFACNVMAENEFSGADFALLSIGEEDIKKIENMFLLKEIGEKAFFGSCGIEVPFLADLNVSSVVPDELDGELNDIKHITEKEFQNYFEETCGENDVFRIESVFAKMLPYRHVNDTVFFHSFGKYSGERIEVGPISLEFLKNQLK